MLYGTGLIKICLPSAPTTGLTVPSGTSIDTATFAGCRPEQPPEYCVVAATDLSIAAGIVRVSGPRPLIIVAVGGIQIQGTLDAGSRSNGGGGWLANVGAGANPASCGKAMPPVVISDRGGGGAGG